MKKVLIIGSGPGGYEAALHARKEGYEVVLVEKDKIGGTCLNRGCIPTKALVEASYLYKKATGGKFGIKGATFDLSEIIAYRNKTTETLRKGLEQTLVKSGVQIVKAEAQFKDGKVIVNGKEESYDYLILATGSRPFIPPFEISTEILTSDNFTEGNFEVKDTIVVGAGVIGLEIGTALAMLGAKVTVIDIAPKILPAAPATVQSRLSAYLKKLGIKFMLNSKVEKIFEKDGKKAVALENGDVVTADQVLVAVGRKPNTEGLESLGLQIDRGFVVTDEYCKAKDNIFAIGDIATRAMLAHTASHHAQVVIDYITGKKRFKKEEFPIPQFVYTQPEAAWVGEFTGRAKKLVLGAVGKAIVDQTEGIIEIHTDGEYVKGFVMIGYGASEIVNLASVVITAKVTVEDIEKIIFAHPTLSEGFKMTLM